MKNHFFFVIFVMFPVPVETCLSAGRDGISVEVSPDILELKDAITERFVKGIRRSFTPCPLIGPKWLQMYPKGRPADFRFFGVRRLAKAIGRPSEKIVEILMKNVSFDGLDVDVQVRPDGLIDIHRRDEKTK